MSKDQKAAPIKKETHIYEVNIEHSEEKIYKQSIRAFQEETIVQIRLKCLQFISIRKFNISLLKNYNRLEKALFITKMTIKKHDSKIVLNGSFDIIYRLIFSHKKFQTERILSINASYIKICNMLTRFLKQLHIKNVKYTSEFQRKLMYYFFRITDDYKRIEKNRFNLMTNLCDNYLLERSQEVNTFKQEVRLFCQKLQRHCAKMYPHLKEAFDFAHELSYFRMKKLQRISMPERQNFIKPGLLSRFMNLFSIESIQKKLFNLLGHLKQTSIYRMMTSLKTKSNNKKSSKRPKVKRLPKLQLQELRKIKNFQKLTQLKSIQSHEQILQSHLKLIQKLDAQEQQVREAQTSMSKQSSQEESSEQQQYNEPEQQSNPSHFLSNITINPKKEELKQKILKQQREQIKKKWLQNNLKKLNDQREEHQQNKSDQKMNKQLQQQEVLVQYEQKQSNNIQQVFHEQENQIKGVSQVSI